MAAHVLPQHARLCHPRPDDGRGGHQGLVVLAVEPTQQTPHGRTLDIEAPQRFADPEVFVHLHIALATVDIEDVNFNTLVLLNQLYTIVDVPNAALT